MFCIDLDKTPSNQISVGSCNGDFELEDVIKKTIANRLEITFYHQEEQESRKLKIKGYGKWKKFKLNAI